MRCIPDASGSSQQPFVCDSVAPGSMVPTDGWGGYNKLAELRYAHVIPVISYPDDPSHVSLPGVQRIAGLCKRWILGIHQGSVAKGHQQSYRGKSPFRFNRRTSHSRGLILLRLL